MKRLILVAVGLFIFLPLTSLKASTAEVPNTAAIIQLVNNERVSKGLKPLKENPSLVKAAQARAQLLASEGVLVHTSATAGQPWPTLQAAGYNYSSAGENLASIPPATMEVIPAWMNSAPHRANVLGDYKEIGIGVAVGPYQGGVAYYIVGYFATPKDMVQENIVQSENQLTQSINTKIVALSKATTREQKIPIIIELIKLLQSYIKLLDSQS